MLVHYRRLLSPETSAGWEWIAKVYWETRGGTQQRNLDGRVEAGRLLERSFGSLLRNNAAVGAAETWSFAGLETLADFFCTMRGGSARA